MNKKRNKIAEYIKAGWSNFHKGMNVYRGYEIMQNLPEWAKNLKDEIWELINVL